MGPSLGLFTLPHGTSRGNVCVCLRGRYKPNRQITGSDVVSFAALGFGNISECAHACLCRPPVEILVVNPPVVLYQYVVTSFD